MGGDGKGRDRRCGRRPRASRLALLLAMLFAGCGSGGGGSDACAGGAACSAGEQIYDFANGAQEWRAGFADYPSGGEELYELRGALMPLPPQLGLAGTGYGLSGINYSDDLFMYLTRRVSGLAPGRVYRIDFVVEFATNAPSGCIGVGGAPGEHVTLKAGASSAEPEALPDADGFQRMSVDKGNQAQGGADASVLGHIGNTNSCPNAAYQLKALGGGHWAAADDSGGLWLIVGTDSGFEGRTALYYRRITVNLTP